MKKTITVGSDRLNDIELIIFDKDGTLIDVHTYWANMIRFRTETISKELGFGDDVKIGLMDSMGVNTEEMRIKPEGPVGIKKRKIVLQSGVDYLYSNGFGDQTDLFFDTFEQVDKKSLDHFDIIIKPIEGLYSLLKELKANGVKTAIATTDLTHRAKLAVDHLKIQDFIDLTIGADMVENPKPNPEIICNICEELKVDISHAIMVGDTKADLQTGINAGCYSIGVASGLESFESLLKLSPYVVNSIADIKA